MPSNPQTINVAVAGTGNNVVVNGRRAFDSSVPSRIMVRGLPGRDVPQVTPGTGTGTGGPGGVQIAPGSSGPGQWMPRGGSFCGVPDAVFDLCGNSFLINGYNVTTSFEGGVGKFDDVPVACVTLVSNLGASCPGEGVRPTFCGADCIEYKGIDAGLWGWFTETLERVFTYQYAQLNGKMSGGNAPSGKPPGNSNGSA
ncbi:hypothetical protein B0H67DRAFT_642508 [Lasiosphaeris hirsuta]|uniref:Uncharacterized protein n=1 Tax=Lasiosphaeris hirsuta TaxID=260670 RepID=A0AA40ANJ2_9PEZI|nr:hypothetical protein B0H67DRAFT_642508 [Lasiosphaeris hirsuta]